MAVDTADIEIRVQRIEQLFDSLDPSPFREKSLDADFKIYLRDSAGEHALRTRLRPHIHLPAELRARGADIESAIQAHSNFLQQAERHRRGSLRRWPTSRSTGTRPKA